MKIRHALPEDDVRLKAIHEHMGIHYELPDLSKMAIKLVFEDDEGCVLMGILLRPTVEAYMLLDTQEKTSARERWSRFLCLHRAALREAAARGFDDGYAFLPPDLDRSFGRKLERLGWFRPWPAWNRIINRNATKDTHQTQLTPCKSNEVQDEDL